jgi:hypothetical protein
MPSKIDATLHQSLDSDRIGCVPYQNNGNDTFTKITNGVIVNLTYIEQTQQFN